MYKLNGHEFSDLIKRSFKNGPERTESNAILAEKFECNAKNLRDENFDILHFKSTFQDDVQVNGHHDTSHVSLHFQLSGYSDANISGFKNYIPMKYGDFNLLNCVDPVSDFFFPKQLKYEYLCIALKPSFFNHTLISCGKPYEDILKKSDKRQSFSLFDNARSVNQWQSNVLKLIMHPPVPDSLKTAYIRSKVTELSLLSISRYTELEFKIVEINSTDKERLYNAYTYISQNYLLPLSLESISARFILNEFKLKKGFKTLFGVTVFGYIQELRMNHANVLISSGGFSIIEISLIIGYESDAAFIRAYKRHFGFTPGKKILNK